MLLALTADELAVDLREIMPSLLGIGPEALGREPAGWTAHHPWSAAPSNRPTSGQTAKPNRSWS